MTDDPPTSGNSLHRRTADEVRELRAEVAELREQLAPLVKLGEVLGPMLAGDVDVDPSDLQALGLMSGLMGG